MKTGWKVLLILIVVVCFAVALSYPVRYLMYQRDNDEGVARLRALREAGQLEVESSPEADQTLAAPDVTPAALPDVTPGASATDGAPAPDGTDAAPDAMGAVPPDMTDAAPDATVAAGTTPGAPASTPAPTLDRWTRKNSVQAYPLKQKIVLDEAKILPEFRALYAMNQDLVGWLTIPDTDIDYPVVQTQDSEYYLKHDFYGNENNNGQIIMDAKCDPYTPSYNIVLSGHNMKSGSMFGNLDKYVRKKYWQAHKLIKFDVLMEKREYVVMAAFYSADYDVDEEGFRYNANIQYALDMETWLEEVRANQLYDTEIDAEFGDEFLTLTTCNREYRKNGRFVLVCRRIREGETFE